MKEVLGVSLIHDHEVRVESQGLVMDAQETVGDGMKGPTPDSGRWTSADHLPGPADHLARGPPRKREQQNRAWIGPVMNQVGDTGSERLGLAGAGPRNHAERAVQMLGRGALLGIERGEEGGVLIGRRRHDESEPWSRTEPLPGNSTLRE